MAELNLRSRAYGGWWGRGLGDEEGSDEGTLSVLTDPVSGELYIPSSQIYGYMQPDITMPGQTPTDATTGQSTNATAYGPPAVTATQIANAIAAAAKVGIQAIAPNAMSGACPAGYVRNGAACVPATTTSPASAPLIAGVSNQTLLMVVGGFLLLMLISQGGGRRR